MPIPDWMTVSEEVREALGARRPVVALESTLIAHGLPWPTNLDTAKAAETTIRDLKVVPATIAVWQGTPTVGLSIAQIEELAQASGVLKASSRDLAIAIWKGKTAATTVAATMRLAHLAGIRVFATGGIGGAHRDCDKTFDISADLFELSRTPVLVVCAGAKSILDLPRTLEILETVGVPVIGYKTDRFPGFYVRDSGLAVSARAENAKEAAALFDSHVRLGSGAAILAQPVADDVAIDEAELEASVRQADSDATKRGIQGGALTPFLLARLAELTGGRTLRANQRLIVANARLAAEVAKELATTASE